MEKMKLLYVGKDTKEFTYNDKKLKPYFTFNNAPTELKDYLQPVDNQFDLKTFLLASKKAGNTILESNTIYLDVVDNNFYYPFVSVLYKYNGPTNTGEAVDVFIQEKLTTIPNTFIIGLNSNKFTNIWKDYFTARGCNIKTDKGVVNIYSEAVIKSSKKYKDDLVVSNIKEINTNDNSKDHGGKLVNIEITVNKHKCKGQEIHSLKQQIRYYCFEYEGQIYYMENYYDGKNLIPRTPNSPYQSGRVYQLK